MNFFREIFKKRARTKVTIRLVVKGTARRGSEYFTIALFERGNNFYVIYTSKSVFFRTKMYRTYEEAEKSLWRLYDALIYYWRNFYHE